MADIHLADAQSAGEGRAHDLLRHQRLLRRHLGAVAAQSSGIRIHGGLRDGLGLELPDVTLIGDGGEIGGGLKLLQLGGVIIGPQPHQHGAGGDIGAGGDVQFVHDARDLGREIGATGSTQCAGDGQLVLPVLQPLPRRRHGGSLRGDAGHDLLQDVRFELVEAEQAAAYHRDGNEQDEAAQPGAGRFVRGSRATMTLVSFMA